MMLLRRQGQVKHVEECVSQEIKAQNPIPMTQQQRLSELEEYLLHFFRVKDHIVIPTILFSLKKEAPDRRLST
jgi:hypothetical protein